MPYENTSPPYVVSADVEGLLTQWSERAGYRAPSSAYIQDLTDELEGALAEAVDAPVEVVNQSDIKQEMEARMKESPFPVISLDRAYITEDSPNVQGFIDATRMVDESFQGIGLQPRPGYPSLEAQMAALRTADTSPITLVDDVIFEGKGALQLAEQLAALNRPVRKVIAGIGIQEGIERIQAAGIEVECFRTFEEVVDEVCERDFFPGVPMSGRTLRTPDGAHWSAPYISPFGDPENWASIPAAHTAEVSKACLGFAVELWTGVEQESRLVVPANQLPRRLQMIDRADSAVSGLTRVLHDLQY